MSQNTEEGNKKEFIFVPTEKCEIHGMGFCPVCAMLSNKLVIKSQVKCTRCNTTFHVDSTTHTNYNELTNLIQCPRCLVQFEVYRKDGSWNSDDELTILHDHPKTISIVPYAEWSKFEFDTCRTCEEQKSQINLYWVFDGRIRCLDCLPSYLSRNQVNMFAARKLIFEQKELRLAINHLEKQLKSDISLDEEKSIELLMKVAHKEIGVLQREQDLLVIK